MLEKTGQLKFIEYLITNEDVTHPKPSAEGYILAMLKMRSEPRNTLIFEDSPIGIVAAQSTGAKVIEVKNVKDVTWDMVKEYL
jgi:pyrophosphatase PpaX